MQRMESSENKIDFERLWFVVTSQFQGVDSSPHGPAHWKRVEENGLLLAQSSGADILVVRLFAVFHDSKRENEGIDPDHGRRGAAYARELRDTYFEIDDVQFDLLEVACSWHTDATHHQNPTIGTCWDADRLDLGRVGITPDPKYMNTDLGKQLAGQCKDGHIRTDFAP